MSSPGQNTTEFPEAFEQFCHAVGQGHVERAREAQQLCWAAGCSLHQAVSPLLHPALCAVDVSTAFVGQLVVSYVSLATLSPTLDPLAGRFAARHFLDAVLAAPNLPLTVSGPIRAGARRGGRGIPRDAFEGFARAIQDCHVRRALHYALQIAATDGVSSLHGIALELALQQLDGAAKRLVTQEALLKLSDALADTGSESLAIAVLTVDNLLAPGFPGMPQPYSRPSKTEAEVFRMVTEQPGHGMVLLPAVIACLRAKDEIPEEVYAHGVAQLEYLAHRAQSMPTGVYNSTAETNTEPYRTIWALRNEFDAEAAARAYLQSRGVTDQFLSDLTLFCCLADTTSPDPDVFILLGAVCEFVRFANEGRVSTDLALAAALQTLRFGRLYVRQWGIRQSKEPSIAKQISDRLFS